MILLMHDRIVSTPDICFGKPRIRGTRMCVHHVLEYIGGGDTIAGLIEEFPYLTEDDIRACFAFAADRTMMPITQIAAE